MGQWRADMTRPLFMLRVEVDGHCRGGPPIKPWVARIDGPCSRFGLARRFIDPMNDWENAHRAQSGNLYGVVATFPLREGHIYEVQRAAGNSSKRHVVREVYWLEGGKMREMDLGEALRHTSGGGAGAPLTVREFRGRTLVTDLTRCDPVAFVTRDRERHYWLLDGREYDVRDVGKRDQDRCRIVKVDGGEFNIRQVYHWPSATLQAS
jgi:hypothetical protein